MSALMQQGSVHLCLRRIKVALLCFSVGANAICAGGVFCFPIISPALASHLKLTQPQLTTIALAGLMGQYPFAAFVGKILDFYGAWVCSLISACLFFAGFGLFANEISKSPDVIPHPPISIFYNLAIFFFVAGLGTVFSHFSSVFAASKNFPKYIGIASGTSMALFGLSPTFLSLLASQYFSYPDGQIDVTSFLRFLAVFCGCVHFIGGFTMHAIPSPPVEESKSVVPENDPETPNERTALLSHRINEDGDELDRVQVNFVPISNEPPELKNRALDLLTDRNFWLLIFIVFVVLGSCEMVLSNIGTIVLSLPNGGTVISATLDASPPVVVAAAQVRILSISNTFSRLLFGPLADIVSPVPSRAIDDNRGFLRPRRISRIAFLAFPTALLVCTYTWTAIGIREQASIWALSIGAGIAYGCTFTILPSLVSSVWGLANLGRNYGILMYAPFAGTPVFSYLYAFVTAAHVADAEAASDEVCRGPGCWALTFEVSALSAGLAFGASVYLWRAWKGRV